MSQITLVRSVGLLCVVLLGAILVHHAPAADDEDAGPQRPPLRYVRVLVPKSDPASWERFRFGYQFGKPVKVEQFRRDLERANASEQSIAPLRPRITAAAYRARLKGESLVGRGVFDIAHADEQPGKLPLSACRFALTDAVWAGGEEALLGVADDGALTAIVEAGGRLQFHWSLRAETDASGVMRFNFAHPAATKTTLEVDVPAAVQLVLSDGVLVKREPADGKFQRYTIELSGLGRTQLVLVPQKVAKSVSGIALVRQRSRYDVDEGGLALRSTLELNVVGRAFSSKSIDLDVDAGLTPVSAKLDGREVAFQTSEDARGITVALSQPLDAAAPHELTLAGLGTVAYGQRMPLPAFRPRNLYWQSGSAQLAVKRGTLLEAINIDGGDLTDVRGSPDDEDGTQASLAYHAMQGRAEISIRRPAPVVSMQPTYAWRISADGMSGRLAAVLQAKAGIIHEIEAAVAPHWRFDERDVHVWTVGDAAGEAPAAIARRLFPAAVSATEDRQTVKLTIDPPLAPGGKMLVEIVARREGPPPAGSFLLGQMMFARFLGLEIDRVKAAVATDSPLAARVQGSNGIEPISSEELDEDTKAWLSAASPTVAFVTTDAMDSVELRLTRQTPQVRARTQIAVHARPDALVESYVVDCIPDSTGIDRLQVTFWPPRAEPLEWTFPEAALDAGVAARRLDSAPPIRDEEAPSPEVWEIQFRQRQTKAFQLTATRASPAVSSTPRAVSLMSVVGAASQQGRLSIFADRGRALTIHARGVQSATPGSQDAPSDEDAVLWGVFRYAPTPTRASLEAAVELASRTSSPPPTVAWDMLLESNIGAAGAGRHRATWRIVNDGSDSIGLQMPADARLSSISVNGVVIDSPAGEANEQQVRIGGFGRRVTLTLEYTLDGSELGMWNAIAAVSPELSIPTLKRRWRVTLPQGYAPIAGEEMAMQTAEPAGIQQRLFGLFRQNTAAISEARLALPIRNPSRDAGADLDPRVALLAAQWSEKPTTWGQALLRTQISADIALSPPLLVDTAAMSAAGIKPYSPIPTTPPLGPVDSLHQILRGSGLALVTGPRRMLLTDGEFIRTHRAQLSPGPAESVWRATAAALEKQFADDDWLAERFATPQVWASASESDGADAWGAVARGAGVQAAPYPLAGDLDRAGLGNVVELALPADRPARVRVYHRDGVRAVALAVLLVFAGGAIWLRWIPLRVLVGACLLAGGAAIWLADPLATIVAGGFGGMLIGAAFAIVRRRGAAPHVLRRGDRDAAEQSASGQSAATTAIATAVVLVWLGVLASPLASSAAEESPIYPVWFPQDKDGNSTGYVHLPEPFADKLEALARSKTAPQPSWLIDKASYELRLGWRGAPLQLEIRELVIKLQIQVLDDSTAVRLPLPRANMDLLDDWAFLNDEAFQPTWRLGQATIDFPVEGRGRHFLQLRVRPAAASEGPLDALLMRVPPVPGAQATITAPADAGRIELYDCLGDVQTKTSDESDETITQASLGPSDKLHVAWPRRKTPPQPSSAYDVQELLWLNPDPQRPTIEARFRVELREGQLDYLLVRAPRELKPLTREVQAVEDGTAAAQTSRVYRLPLAGGGDDDGMTAAVSFALDALPAAGQYAVPVIEALDARRRKRWLAVSGQESWRATAGTALTPTDENEFLSRWGDVTQPPAQAFAWSTGEPIALLRLTPLVDRPACDESLVCTFSRRRGELTYRAVVESSDKAIQHCVLDVPASVEIQSVAAVANSTESNGSVNQDAAKDRVRWWALREGQLHVFLDAPSGLSWELAVQGEMPVARRGRVATPTIRFRAVDIVSSQLELRRRFDVLMDVVDRSAYNDADADGDAVESADAGQAADSHANAESAFRSPASPSADPQLFRRVALYDAKLSDAAPHARPCVIQLRPNAPQSRGVQLSRLISDEGVWSLIVDVDLDVTTGQLDAVRFDVPASIAEKLSLDPPQPHEFRETFDAGIRQLTMTPATAIDGHFHARLIAHDLFAPGDEVGAIDVRPQAGLDLKRYLALPKSFESRDIAWDTDDSLLPVSRPEELDLPGDPLAGNRVYRITADPYQANLRSVTEAAGVPLVRLADNYFAWDATGQCWGRASFDIEPAGLTECVVELPSRMSLARVRVDDLPAQTKQPAPQRWIVQLTSPRLPQRVEVLYTGAIDVDRRRPTIDAVAPTLAGVAVERTLWTVYAPAWAGRASAEGASLSSVRQDAIRLRSLTNLVRLPRHLRLELSAAETANWLAPWRERWQRQRDALQRGVLTRGALTPAEPQAFKLQDVDFSFQQNLDELDLPGGQNNAAGPPLADAERFWSSFVASQNVAARRAVKGTSSGLTLRFDDPPRPGWSVWRPLVLGLFVLAACLAFGARRWLPASDWPARCALPLTVAAALALALAVCTSLVFWCVVLLAVIAYWRLRRRRPPDPFLAAILVRSAGEDGS